MDASAEYNENDANASGADGGTTESVDEISSFLSERDRDAGNSFDAGREEALAQQKAIDSVKTYSSSEVGEAASEEVKTGSASEVSTEASSGDGLKKNYDTEEDAYSAYVQWKKDHGITIDNPDPFHNIHHNGNRNDNADGEE